MASMGAARHFIYLIDSADLTRNDYLYAAVFVTDDPEQARQIAIHLETAFCNDHLEYSCVVKSERQLGCALTLLAEKCLAGIRESLKAEGGHPFSFETGAYSMALDWLKENGRTGERQVEVRADELSNAQLDYSRPSPVKSLMGDPPIIDASFLPTARNEALQIGLRRDTVPSQLMMSLWPPPLKTDEEWAHTAEVPQEEEQRHRYAITWLYAYARDGERSANVHRDAWTEVLSVCDFSLPLQSVREWRQQYQRYFDWLSRALHAHCLALLDDEIHDMIQSLWPERFLSDSPFSLRGYWKENFLLPIEQKLLLLCASVRDENEALRDTSGDSRPSRWEPREGYIGVKKVMLDPRFRKNDKNPPRSTIQYWIERDHPEVDKAPDSQEVYVPREWLEGRVKKWTPRNPAE